jgi:tripartite-type tricarboxylate transporter receptor subunit TctC
MKNNCVKKKIVPLIVMLLVMIISTNVIAQSKSWPDKEITILVPFGIGGSTDFLARNIIAPLLQKEFGVPVLVENKDGGATMLGTLHYLDNMQKDGSVVYFTNAINLVFGRQTTKTQIDPSEDFAWIGNLRTDDYGLFVRGDAPWNTFGDLIHEILNNPGKINIGVLGSSPGHAIMLSLDEIAGIKGKYNLAIYDGGGEARLAVLGNHIHASILATDGTLTTVGEGEIRFLGIAGDVEHPTGIPTFNQGLEEIGIDGKIPRIGMYYCLGLQKEVGENHKDRWDFWLNVFEKITNNPEFDQKFEEAEFRKRIILSEEFTEIIKEIDMVAEKYSEFF